MLTTPANRWAVPSATFVLWALVAASAVYWGLKLGSGRDVAVAPLPPRPVMQADPLAVARLLGATSGTIAAAPTPSAASRFNLVGVVASASNEGAALISVDGKPARPYRVGAQVDEGLVLQSVNARGAALGPGNGPASVTLDLPLRK